MSVRAGLLALLDAGPSHGYQLKSEFEAVTGGVWVLNVGQVYTTLDRLCRDGLVDVEIHTDESGVDQKRYAITAAGREELGTWWDATPGDEPPPRDELQLKVLMAISRGPGHALGVITRQRSALTALLQQRRRDARSASGDLAAAVILDALITRAEADLRWLDLCEARLVRLAESSTR